MTENEWLASTDPQAMLAWMRRPRGPFLGLSTGDPTRPNVDASDRKLRLFACACCRQALQATGTYGLSTHSVRLCDLSDRYADGELEYLSLEGFVPSHPDCSWPLRYDRNVHITVMNVINAKPFLSLQAALLRDIFGNPYVSYRWSNTNENSWNTVAGRHSENSSAPIRHVASLGENSPTGRMGNEGGVSVEGGGGASGSGGIYPSPRQRRQPGRPAEQPSFNTSRDASAIPRRCFEGASDRDGVRDTDNQMQQMPRELPRVLPEKGQRLPKLPMGTPQDAEKTQVRGNGSVVLLNPSILTWHDRTVPRLAQSIYDDRAFERMPILADAMEEAGCDDKAILRHCRQPGPHARGCWVLDLLLGEE